jgi:predicted nucleic acid-binding protein
MTRGYGRRLLLDWSAYARVLLAYRNGPGGGRLTAAQLSRFEEAALDGDLVVSPPFRMEALYSATGARDFRELREELDGFDQAVADATTWDVAILAQETLAATRGVSHRVKLADLLVAAIAHQRGLGVLHYDKDYATIAARARLELEDVWIAPRGSVD